MSKVSSSTRFCNLLSRFVRLVFGSHVHQTADVADDFARRRIAQRLAIVFDVNRARADTEGDDFFFEVRAACFGFGGFA